jgi:hypothetical protein
MIRRRCQLDRSRCQPSALDPRVAWKKQVDPTAASRAVKEYLATLNDAAFEAATEVQPKFVSPSDPAAQWTGALKGPAFFAYAAGLFPVPPFVNRLITILPTKFCAL